MKNFLNIPFWLVFCSYIFFRPISVLSQYPELETIDKQLKKSQPQSQESFELMLQFGELLMVMGRDEFEKLTPDSIIVYGEGAIAWARENGSPDQLAKAQRYLVECYILANEHTKFLKLAGEMVAMNSFASQEDKIQVYRHLAPIYLDIGYIEKFIELTEELSKIRKDLDEPDSYLVNEHSHIAQAYSRLKDYKRARLYYYKALEVLEKGENLLAVAIISNKIGLAFSNEGRKDSAKIYFTKAIDILKGNFTPESGFGTSAYNQHLSNQIEANMAMLTVDEGQYDAAIKAVEKELNSAVKQNEIETIIQANHKLGRLHYQKMNYSLAIQYLNQAIQQINPPYENQLLLENWRTRYKILLASGKQQAGETLYKKMMILQDSITSATRDNSAMVASIAYETNKKESTLRQQTFLLKMQENELHASKRQQFSYILGIVGIGILFFITYYFLQKVRKQKREIEHQKLELDKSLREKEILLKEVHHRVKNNLQVVSSILARQGRNTDNPQVKKYMEEGQNRIQSMAMVHQQLYQNQDFENINLSEYTHLLLVNIMNYYSQEGQQIDVEMEVASLPFHVDIAIPYGLILNELVSNCFEYGFAGRDKGKLIIEMKKVDHNLFMLRVVDDGNGLPDDMKKRSEKSLGINLVKGIAWQLRGELKYYNAHPGSIFEVTFLNDLKHVS